MPLLAVLIGMFFESSHSLPGVCKLEPLLSAVFVFRCARFVPCFVGAGAVLPDQVSDNRSHSGGSLLACQMYDVAKSCHRADYKRHRWLASIRLRPAGQTHRRGAHGRLRQAAIDRQIIARHPFCREALLERSANLGAIDLA